MKRSILYALVLVLLGVSTTKVSAQISEMPPANRRYAVLIGISQYKALPGLRSAASDVAAMRDVVISKLGFPVENVTVISSDQPDWAPQGNRSGIYTQLFKLMDTVPKGSLLLFYYSGYGFDFNGDAYLLPSDAALPSRGLSSRDVSLLLQTSISVSSVEESIANSGATAAIVLFDACLVDPLSSEHRTDKSFVPKLIFSPTDPSKSGLQSLAVITATSPGGLAFYDGTSNLGVFTSEILRGLTGAAALPGSSQVTLASLTDYLMVSVPKRTFAMGGIAQQPFSQISGFDSGRFVLTNAIDTKSLATSPFLVSATIHATAEVAIPVLKRFHIDDGSDDCRISQDRIAQFCFTEADTVDSWDKPTVSSANCPKNASFIKNVSQLDSDRKCVSAQYHLQGCGADQLLGIKNCRGRAWLVADLTVRGTQYKPLVLEDFDWQGKVGDPDSVRQIVQYPPNSKSPKKITYKYDVLVSRASDGTRSGSNVIHLTNSNPEFNGVRTSISDDGQLVIDLTNAVGSNLPQR